MVAPVLKHYPMEVENQELFVAVCASPGAVTDFVLQKYGEYQELKEYLDINYIQKAVQEASKLNACYVYLGNHGRHAHLLFFKLPPYMYQIAHELEHMAFQTLKLADMDPNDHSGEEYFCMLTSHWFIKLQRDLPITKLPREG